MTLLLISDLHSQNKTLHYLKETIGQHKPDGVICAGDITQRGDIEFFEKLSLIIKQNNIAAFMIWGNSDAKEVQQEILKSPYNIHLTKRKIGTWSIIGLSDQDEAIQIDPAQIKGSIFVTHQPPIKNLLNKKFANAPLYHLSGHLHFGRWVRKYPSTIQIQIPTLISGEFALFDPDTKKVKFLKLKEIG